MLWLLYRGVVAGALVLAAPVLLLTRGGHYLPTLRSRLGLRREPSALPGSLWVHAVSVGEVAVAETLVEKWADRPLLITTVTPTGQARAKEVFAGRDGTTVTYLPFDLGFAVRRFFQRHRPAALVLVEGDYWPLVLRTARRRGLPIAVINGRVGRTSHQRLSRWKGVARLLFWQWVDRFGVQTEQDRSRLLDAGVDADRIDVTGNLKFEMPEPPERPEASALLERCADGRPILLAGSTMQGEEAAILDAFAALGGGQRMLLAIAPRHPERFDPVAREIESRGHRLARRSSDLIGDRPDVLLLDSLGELASLYRHATIAFVGGTLVPTGGHNPLEPARFGVPVVVGPSMENFAEIERHFDAAEAWGRARDAEELAQLVRGWLDAPETAHAVGGRGEALVQRHRGALGRTLAFLDELMPPTEGSR